MNERPATPASLPPAGITGLDPAWSRLVTVPDTNDVDRTWHILDTWACKPAGSEPAMTLICVHGNPSWSFLWRDLLAKASTTNGPPVRVVAVDQLDMGFSERTGQKRTLSTRVDDLCQLTTALGIRGSVITVAHDWGGPVSLGWALRYLPKSGSANETHATGSPSLAGVVLTNTAVHQPDSASAPAVIRLIRSPLILNLVTINTRAFIRGAIDMSRPRLRPEVREGFHAPYLRRSQRTAIADFVKDIPLEAQHESASTLDAIAEGLSQLAHVPALLLWGPRDRVFSDLYLHDLERRLPHADVQRFPNAAHFVGEDADVAGAVLSWISQSPQLTGRPDDRTLVKSDLHSASIARALSDFSNADPNANAIVEIAPNHRAISFAELQRQVEQLAAGMTSFGIRSGDRVAVMVMPGIDLSLTVYGCWRLGATLVLVDSGLGRTGMQRALRSANPDYLIGIDKALIAAKLLNWPGVRIAVKPRSALMTKFLGIVTDLQTLINKGTALAAPPFPDTQVLAALAFTSGSTGPSKGVIYTHQQIQAQRDALLSLYQITPDDRLVAAFAPFALYGPTMGITSIVPKMDVTAPGSLTAPALAEACSCIAATLVFASPAALVNVVKTVETLTTAQQTACSQVRAVISAGAPVRVELLEAANTVFEAAEMYTPYGMTEVLPVANISLHELRQLAGSQSHDNEQHRAGVCVGHPLSGVRVMIDPLNRTGMPTGKPSAAPNLLGEILVQAAHARERYDRLWLTNHLASQPAGWHRTGDIGQLDTAGRLWVGGRLGHVITTSSGVLAPVDSEQRIERIDQVSMAALVGVGPVGTQAVVAVLQMPTNDQPTPHASTDLTDQVRQVVAPAVDIAVVLIATQLPVDRRHNSKIDRTAIATWAEDVLAGERVALL